MLHQPGLSLGEIYRLVHVRPRPSLCKPVSSPPPRPTGRNPGQECVRYLLFLTSRFSHATVHEFRCIYEPPSIQTRQHDGYIREDISRKVQHRPRTKTCVGFSVTIVRKICTAMGGEESCLFSSRWTWLCLPCTASQGSREGASSLCLLWIPKPRSNGPGGH